MKALYRKYRPKSLAEVVGQPQVSDILAKSLAEGKISHAYLFTGPRGTGKTSVARIFAHEVNSFPYELEDSYLDIIEIDAASNTGVDNIRDLREKAAIAPTKGRYKVYIIDEVHMLSKSAFNALLKTLEEPPAHVIFLLATTDIEKVPVTITSRVQIFTFKLANPDLMQSHLREICDKEGIKISDAALELIVRRGGGSFRDSLSLLDQISTLAAPDSEISKDLVESSLGLPQDELIKNLLSAYRSADFAEITALLRDTLNSGLKPETLAEELIEFILAAPDPVYLPLLDRLPTVRGVFPEAKLLVALAPPTPTPNSPKPASIPSREPTGVIGARTKVPTFLPPKHSANPENPPETAPIPSREPTGVMGARTKVPTNPPKTASFNWDSYLNAVKRSSLGAAMWLRKADHVFSAGTLHLYPPTPTAKGILTSANNHQILVSCLAPFALEIHDPGDPLVSPDPTPTAPENPPDPTQSPNILTSTQSPNSPISAKNPPNLAQINDIMGEVKELNIDGGELPF